MSTTFDRIHIEPLSDKAGLQGWQAKMRDILEELDLWDYVTGEAKAPTLPAPNTGEDDAAYKTRIAAEITKLNEWKKKDGRAKRAMRLRINGTLLLHFVNVETSYKLWFSISEYFRPTTLMGPVLLKRKLATLKLQDGDDMQKHLDAIDELVIDLSVLEHPIDDTELVTNLLLSLPESYDLFISALPSDLLDKPLKIKERLRAEAERREYRRTDGSSSASAFQARDQKSRKFSPKKKDVKCHHCGILGHYSKECRKRLRGDPQTPAGKAARDAMHQVKTNSSNNDFTFAITSSDVPTGKSVWLADTGATTHFCTDRAAFTTFTPTSETAGAYSTRVPILGRGTVKLGLVTADRVNKVTLTNVAYVPSAEYNLFSLGRLASINGSFEGKGINLLMYYPNGTILGIGKKVDRLYHLSTSQDTLPDIAMVANETTRSLRDWHRSLGHINEQSIRRLAVDEGIHITDPTSHLPLSSCIPCIEGKQHRLPLPTTSSSDHTSIKPGELASVDIWGPARTQSIGGYEYHCKIVDFATRWDSSQPLKTKDEIRRTLYQYREQIENITGNKLKFIRVDNAMELVNSGEFKDWCKDHGIQIQTTSPYTSSQNGIAERAHRTTLESTRAMLADSKLPAQYWALAVQYANYIRNRSPSKFLKGNTPYRALFNKAPDYSMIRPFGADCYVLIQPDTKINKIKAKSQKATFVGLSDTSKAYFYMLPYLRKPQASRNIIFPSTPSDTPPSIGSFDQAEEEIVTPPVQEESSTPPATVTPAMPSAPMTTVPPSPPSNSHAPSGNAVWLISALKRQKHQKHCKAI